jgi:hypothetical protein
MFTPDPSHNGFNLSGAFSASGTFASWSADLSFVFGVSSGAATIGGFQTSFSDAALTDSCPGFSEAIVGTQLDTGLMAANAASIDDLTCAGQKQTNPSIVDGPFILTRLYEASAGFSAAAEGGSASFDLASFEFGTAVPEPGGLVLLGSSLLALAARLRRK